jgi:tRNA-splicing ligase RtcB
MTPMVLGDLEAESPVRWRLPQRGAMRVPGIVFASADLLPALAEGQALQQVANVATLQGIVEASYAMPDVHWGYGFPIGGVAATAVDEGGVVSPGGVGFDISCGVRLLLAPLHVRELADPDRLLDALAVRIPRGLGRGSVRELRAAELEQVLRSGARFAVEQGLGVAGDLDHCEDGGAVADADPSQVGDRARARGRHQLGSLGSGNHFLEVQAVERVVDATVADVLGLWPGRVCVMIHTGSRGLGHQVCSDHVRRMATAMPQYGITVPDRQLACAPVTSPEGRAYLGAMAAAANFGRANRQLLTEATRDAFADATGHRDLQLLYDVSHNLAKLERHVVDGVTRLLCVHRKGATRILPPRHADLPADLAAIGQPALIPGSMGTASYVMVGTPAATAFASTCHGAGRRLSRHAAKRRIRGAALRTELEQQGIRVRAGSLAGLAEEAPFAYKDIDAVVETCERADLGRRVARLRPLGVVKG